MGNIFNDILNGEFDQEYFTEVAYPDDIPYLKTVKRNVLLPQGNPIGRGCFCYLYTHSFEESLELIKNPSNLLSKNKYHYYFYNVDYLGKIFGRKYKYRDFDLRKTYYEKIKSETKLLPILGLNKLTNNKNLFFDMHKYINIFESMSVKQQQGRYLNAYWEYIREIYDIKVVNTKGDLYTKPFVLVDISKFKAGKLWKENIENPLYLIYYGVYRKVPALVGNKKLGKTPLDLDFIFFSGKKVLKVNPVMLNMEKDPSVLRKFRVELLRILNNISKKEDIELATSEEEMQKEELEDKVVSRVTAVVNPSNDSPIIADANKKMNKVAGVSSPKLSKIEHIQRELEKDAKEKLKEKENILDTSPENIDQAATSTDAEIKRQLEEDKQKIAQIYRAMKDTQPKKSEASTARDKELREKQKEINVAGMTIGDLEKIKANNIPVPVRDVSNAVSTSNENMKQLRFINFDKTYNEKLMKKDIVNAFLSLNDKSIPIFIRDIQVKDTSNELNYKDTYTVLFEDGNRKRHTIKVDIPKFIDNKFFYLGGNKKIMKHQNFYQPVVKISPSMVQIVSNYSKMTIERVDNKSISSIERLKKFINKNEEAKKYFGIGNAYAVNSDFVTTIEYDDLSKSFQKFEIANTKLFFSQVDAKEFMKKSSKPIPEKKNKIFIGLFKGEPCYIDYDTQETDEGYSITDLIAMELPQDLSEEFSRTKAPKKLIYAKVKLMAQFMNVGMLLGMWEGISTLLRKMKVEYRLENRVPTSLHSYEDFIKFKDCVLVYKQNVPNAMILNGIKAFSTEQYNLVDFDESLPYLDYIRKVYGKSIIENAIQNFYEFFIDTITLEILKDQDLPTDIVSLMIYAINLLADSRYIPNINENLYRIRLGEIIPAILYEKIAKNYVQYRTSNGRKKYSIPQDCVIKEILGLKTVEDYSTLNPTLELQQTHALSSKGFNGVNLDDAYTVPRRAYDPSMIGIIAPGTSPDASVGIAKFLTMEPNITNLRGYIDDKHEKLDELKDVNLFSPAELTLPGATTVDEPNRLGHALNFEALYGDI